MSAAERDEMSDDDLDRLIRSARDNLASELDRSVDLDATLQRITLAAPDADDPDADDPGDPIAGQAGVPGWAAVLAFPLPVPDEPAALAAAGPAGGSPPVIRAVSPDGLATYSLYHRGDGEYWAEVSLAADAATPAIASVHYTARPPGAAVLGAAAGVSRRLLIPVDGEDDGTPASLVRLPWFVPGDWEGTGPVSPRDVPAWEPAVVRASVEVAVTAATVRAWQRVAELVAPDTRQLILDALSEDDE